MHQGIICRKGVGVVELCHQTEVFTHTLQNQTVIYWVCCFSTPYISGAIFNSIAHLVWKFYRL